MSTEGDLAVLSSDSGFYVKAGRACLLEGRACGSKVLGGRD